jgi:release factor glutamine methyltransferase
MYQPSSSGAAPADGSRPEVPDVGRLVSELRTAGCVFAEEEARLLLAAGGSAAELQTLLDRRIGGEPLEHVLGWVEFAGLRITLQPGVFVPRRRSAVLAAEAVTLARTALARRTRPASPARRSAGVPGEAVAVEAVPVEVPAAEAVPVDVVAVDLCCGSGAIGAVMLDAIDGLELYAVDVDRVAVRCAEHNLAVRGGRVYEGDLFEPLPSELRGRVDVAVANAPYVPSDAIMLMPPEARLHEPRHALDGGRDGLGTLRRLVAAAPGWLAPGGHVLFEASDEQAPAAMAALTAAGLSPAMINRPDHDATVVVGTKARTGQPEKPL